MRLPTLLAAILLSSACGSDSPSSPTSPSPSRAQTKTATITSFSFTPTSGVFSLPNGVSSRWTVTLALNGFSPTETLFFHQCLTDPNSGSVCAGEERVVGDLLTSPLILTGGAYLRSATVVDSDLWILDGPSSVPPVAFARPTKFYDHKHVDVSIRFVP
jgi:hypothetical protein